LSNHFGASISAPGPTRRAVLERDTHARVGLGRLGQRDGAEAEGQAQMHVALAQDHVAERRSGALSAGASPAGLAQMSRRA